MMKKAIYLLCITATLGWSFSALLYVRSTSMETSLKSDINDLETKYHDLQTQYGELLTNYSRIYREWTTLPEDIPETEEGREQLAINIVNANRQEYVRLGYSRPLYNITWYVRHASAFWYKILYDGLDDEGTVHHSVTIYVNIASSEMFAEAIAEILFPKTAPDR